MKSIASALICILIGATAACGQYSSSGWAGINVNAAGELSPSTASQAVERVANGVLATNMPDLQTVLVAGNTSSVGLAIGPNCAVTADELGDGGVAIGNASAAGPLSLAVGENATATGNVTLAFGVMTEATGTRSVALGSRAKATNDYTFVWSSVPAEADPSVTYGSPGAGTFNVSAAGGIHLDTDAGTDGVFLDGTSLTDILAGTGGGVASVTATNGIEDTGTATDPVLSLASDALSYIRPMAGTNYFLASSTNQTFTNGVNTPLIFAAADENPGGILNTNDWTFTMPLGTFMASGFVQITSEADGRQNLLFLFRNDSFYKRLAVIRTSAAGVAATGGCDIGVNDSLTNKWSIVFQQGDSSAKTANVVLGAAAYIGP